MNKLDILIVENKTTNSTTIQEKLTNLRHNVYTLSYKDYLEKQVHNIDIIILNASNQNRVLSTIKKKTFPQYVLLIDPKDFDFYNDNSTTRDIPNITLQSNTIELSAIIKTIMQCKKIETEKSLSNDLFQLSMYVENAGRWTWDLDTDEVIWDSTMHRIFGLETDTFSGKLEEWKAYVSENDREIFGAIMMYSKGKAKNIEVEYRIDIETDNGKQNRLISTQGIKKEEEGKQGQFIGITYDITEKHLTEQVIRESESRYKELIDTLPDIIYEYSSRAGIKYWSPAAKKILGYSNDDISTNPFIWFDAIHPEDQNKFTNSISNHKKDISFEIEYRIKNKEGNWLWFNNRAILIKETDEDETIIEGIATDITARKLAEQSLKESEERFRQLVDSINNVFFLITPDWNQIIYASPAYNKIWKKKLSELMMEPRSWLNNIIDEDRDKVIADINIKMHGDYHNNRLPEFRIKWPDKTLRWIVFNVFPIRNKQNKIYRVAGIASDITERKTLENNLYEAKTLADQANKAKSEFLANMSHELRTPLNAVLGFSQIMEMQTKNKNFNKQSEYISYIKDNASHVLEMVNDILDLAKIEAGKFEINKKAFDFVVMLKRSPSTIKSIANLKNISLKLDIADDIGWFYGDEIRIKQVIYNLLSNAIKFTDEDKEVGIQAYGNKDKIFVSIWDQGIGIPQNETHKIFAPFEQIKSVVSIKKRGTGLGLAISKQIIELHNGSITVESELNEGSKFTIILPNRIVDKSIITPELEVETKINQIMIWNNKLLLVEDNEVNRMLAKEFFDIHGFDVDYAESGERAVELAAEHFYNLIFMDIQLPGITGIEAMKKIREKYDYHVPIIALTAFAMKGDKNKYLQEGFDDYLSKPIIFKHMIDMINLYLNLEVKEVKLEQPHISHENLHTIDEDVPDATADELEIFDYQTVLERYLNNFDLVKDVTTVFVKKVKKQIVIIDKAIKDNDFDILRAEAHSIKGSALNLQMQRIGDTAFELEKIGKHESRKPADETLKELKGYFTQLLEILKEKEIYSDEDDTE